MASNNVLSTAIRRHIDVGMLLFYCCESTGCKKREDRRYYMYSQYFQIYQKKMVTNIGHDFHMLWFDSLRHGQQYLFHVETGLSGLSQY